MRVSLWSSGGSRRRTAHVWVLLPVLLLMAGRCAYAGGPRFVTGTTYANQGQWMAFRTPNVSYYTDPGDLNASVAHAQADAIVAAAAAVWNVPSASLVLAQGGALSEHVSSKNTYFDGENVIFPADVQATNFLAKPVAVIYDSDGSVIDLLLGVSASDPSSCRQNSVVESVDGFGATGTIDHALLILNGRCVTNTADSLKQMQYYLMRGFGRVLGLAWSQTNDNVFTASPLPSASQMAYWPVMHPIDVLCGPYTYLCMQNPFVLRPDDLSALAMLYPVTASNLSAGKVLSDTGSAQIWGYLRFPDPFVVGVDEVNVTINISQLFHAQHDYQIASGLSGILFQQNNGNPMTGPEPDEENVGSVQDRNSAGYYDVHRIPHPDSDTWVMEVFESINPLYSGEYALGSFERPPVSFDIDAATIYAVLPSSGSQSMEIYQFFDNAANTCRTATNGAIDAPPVVASSGWWTDVLCDSNWPAWKQASLKAGHSWTLESTALDSAGNISAAKAQPVFGVWYTSDRYDALPTVAANTVPMNGATNGLTQLHVAAASADATYRIGLADYYSEGRPDFFYRARLLYADALAPASVGAAGGTVTVTGMGFANGNRVTVNGVTAKVVSWSPSSITAVAPSSTAAGAKAGVPVTVAVTDLTTGGSTAITGALRYGAAGAYGVLLLSAPSALSTGSVAATPFQVKVVAADGVTAIAGAKVSFAVAVGSAMLNACGSPQSCTLVTDASGTASTTVTGTSAGAVVLTATESSGGASVSVQLTDTDPVRSVLMRSAPLYVAAGASWSTPIQLYALQDGAAASAAPVIWSASAGLLLSSVSTLTDAGGAASATVLDNALAAGQASVQGCVWTTVCASWTLVSVDPSLWQVAVVSGAGQSVEIPAALAPVTLQLTDGSGHPLAGAPVSVAQTVTAWEGECPDRGRCPAAPVLASAQSMAASDANGLVSVAPLSVAASAGMTNIAVSTGNNGFVSLTLARAP
ncbi:MAG: IPT/TIG domain-containing protein [Acidobacteriaceae bacterium]|nr:IPT/TIG domain-containing protein [Acidobacteriaceae bacterium]